MNNLFDFFRPFDWENDFPLRGKYKNLCKVMDKMLETQPDLRPNCESILNESVLWSLDLNYFKNDSQFAKICEQTFDLERFQDNFHSVFINWKLKLQDMNENLN